MKKEISGKQDVYLDIADKFEAYIKAGVYRNGDKLPSVRVAAGDLNVNPNTVARAYSTLEERGLVRCMLKKGAFVTVEKFGKAESLGQFKQITSELKLSGVSKEELLAILEEVYQDDQSK